MSFSRWVLHMDPLHLVRFEASLPTRRDTRFRPNVVRQAAPGCLVILTRALRVPVLTVTSGQSRSLLSSVAGFPQVSILLVRTMIHPRSSKLGLRCAITVSGNSLMTPHRSICIGIPQIGQWQPAATSD